MLFLLALGGSFVSYIYSAPPLKLKQNGWLGNYALGASYIALPWWAGQALFGQLTWLRRCSRSLTALLAWALLWSTTSKVWKVIALSGFSHSLLHLELGPQAGSALG